MMRGYIETARHLPPRVVLRRAVDFAGRQAYAFFERRRDSHAQTYAANDGGALDHRLRDLPIEAIRPHRDWLAGVTRHFLAHRFDLLGSGWVEVRHGLVARGLEGHLYPPGPTVTADPTGAWLGGRINQSNLAESQRIWSLVDAGYRPIDWHLDVRSGYRWREDAWHLDVPFGRDPGVDIKLPWELARMQHLPQLALAYLLARADEPGFAPAEAYMREFRNQALDFIAANPPRYGINWRIAMEPAIRIVNWLVAWDLFALGGAAFDAPFAALLARSVREHGRHIAANLEALGGFRGNHYLADICGLAFAAAWLPQDDESDAWLALAARELAVQTQAQFHADGSNFEASTCYHRLSAEMVIFATAVLASLPAGKRVVLEREKLLPFAPSHAARIAAMSRFTEAVTKPSGRVAMIGDNDSGRLLKLAPAYCALTVAEARRRYASLAGYTDLPDNETHWDEDHLDHHGLVAAASGLFATGAESRQYDHLEAVLIRALVGDRALPTPADAPPRPLPHESPPAAATPLTRIEIATGAGLRDALAVTPFPDFGLYIYRSRRLFLAVRCGSIGQNGRGGHAHNDQLSIELAIDGEDWIVDPGTYLYTPLPATRNRYRSIAAHCAPRLGLGEPARLDRGVFWMPDDPHARCHRCNEDEFIGSHDGFGAVVVRRIIVADDRLIIEDRTDAPAAGPPAAITCAGRDETRSRLQPQLPISPGYGVLLAS